LGQDIPLSEPFMRSVRHEYMKIRKTFRTLIGHLFDFDPQIHSIELDRLLPVDQYALQTLNSIYTKVIKCYNTFDLATGMKIIINYFKIDLRCGYLESGKTRLYFEKCDSFGRRSAQTAVSLILDTTVKLVAPVLSFLAEEVYDAFKSGTTSIHLQLFRTPPNVWQEISTKQTDPKTFIAAKYKQHSLLEKIMTQTTKEIAKNQLGHTGNMLRAHVTLFVLAESEAATALVSMKSTTSELENLLEEYLSVSRVSLMIGAETSTNFLREGFYLTATQAEGVECARCWRWRELDPAGICLKCSEVIQEMDHESI